MTSIAQGQIITTGLINVRRFQPRARRAAHHGRESVRRRVDLRDGTGTAAIEDAAIERNRIGEWAISQLFLRRPRTGVSPFSKGPTTFATWEEVVEQTAPGQAQSAEHLAQSYAELWPADLANTLLDLPRERRMAVVSELSDERLADALEEMPEDGPGSDPRIHRRRARGRRPRRHGAR